MFGTQILTSDFPFDPGWMPLVFSTQIGPDTHTAVDAANEATGHCQGQKPG
jgi:hypothetical protein